MTTRTEAELADNVLRDLGVLDALDTASSSDANYVIGRYRSLYEELADDQLAYWPVAEIPSVIFEALTQYVVLSVARPYGKMVSAVDLEEGLRVIRRRLRRHAGKKSSGLPAEIEYY